MLTCASSTLGAHLALKTMLARVAPLGAERLAQSLTSGIRDLESARPAIGIMHIAHLARREPDARAAHRAGVDRGARRDPRRADAPRAPELPRALRRPRGARGRALDAALAGGPAARAARCCASALRGERASSTLEGALARQGEGRRRDGDARSRASTSSSRPACATSSRARRGRRACASGCGRG